MAKLIERAEVYFGDSVIRCGGVDELGFGRQYAELMYRLYGEHAPVHRYQNPGEMRSILERPYCLMSFVVLDGQLVSTAEALLVRSEPVWNVFFGNIITRGGFDRHGLGALVHESLEEHAVRTWGHNRLLYLTLTNNPKKGNSGFYTERGWQDKGTSVYVKLHRPG